MELDPDLLLTAENLRLETGLVRGQEVRGTVAFKRLPSQTYLVVDSLQAQVLEEFAQPRNVPAVLENCIRKRICPSLREFYDLILKAHRAGVLRTEELGADGPVAAAKPPVRWFVSVPAEFVLGLAALSALALLVVAVLRPPLLPVDVTNILLGWAAACAAVSLGHLLAASVVRNAGGEVQRPRFDFFSPTPHFSFDLDETCMLTRRHRAAALASVAVPLTITIAVALWQRQAWATVLLGALFLVCRPVGSGIVGKFLTLFRRRPLIATDGPALFDVEASLLEEWRVLWRRFDPRVASAQFGYGILWAVAFGAEAYRLWHVPLVQLWANRAEWRIPALLVLDAIALILLVALVIKVQHRVVDECVTVFKAWRLNWRRWRTKLSDIDPAQFEALLRKNPLLRRLEPEALAEVIEHLQPLEAKPWQKIIAFDSDPAFVGIVVSGRGTVYQRLKSGRKSRFLRIVEGDLFGAHRLFDPVHGNLEIRAATPVIAARLSCEDFQRLIVDRLGGPVVSCYVQSHLFLQRASPLCAEWRPAAVARFAELATTMSLGAGGKILVQGQEVSSLYVLYDGEARTIKDRKPIARIVPGDFFGEISLLQTSAATADVESKEDSRCLAVNRVEFIRFISRNHHVALQMERLCSSRLGRPIFPLSRESFDVR